MSIKVVELFAGVGGFRIGLENYPRAEDSAYSVVWSNQWEPSTKLQHASLVYENRWPNSNHSNQNIEEVIENDFDQIPNHDLLVGGFPCQDYSVATSLKNSKGLRGKKGVLWWSIEAILRQKGTKAPKYLMLENVDRLLKSPAKQRGRDFAIMLSSLNALGYAVEWRVINAAEYGMPQRRRRVFILGYHKSTELYRRLESASKTEWLKFDGVITKEFPVSDDFGDVSIGTVNADIQVVSDEFNKSGGNSPFQNSGVMINGNYWTVKTNSKYNGARTMLKDVLEKTEDVPKEFFISPEELNKEKGWEYLKGSKRIERTNSQGHTYVYSEGGMVFPDALDAPSRTIITGEGGKAPSRFKHVIFHDGRHRRLVPKELEQLNMFPKNHTKLDGVTDQKRAFFMGNALVVGIVEKLGVSLAREIGLEIPVLEKQAELG
ncbi:MAG: DNA (cytosine-5-)-methyltransferase [Flavobacteriales bacterium]|jgi:DNA (cytosine-5)-methyltransferase 1|nr:DNA (cytosine-5-)-methyltransferase [Flavobacteriales bacterium]